MQLRRSGFPFPAEKALSGQGVRCIMALIRIIDREVGPMRKHHLNLDEDRINENLTKERPI